MDKVAGGGKHYGEIPNHKHAIPVSGPADQVILSSVNAQRSKPERQDLRCQNPHGRPDMHQHPNERTGLSSAELKANQSG